MKKKMLKCLLNSSFTFVSKYECREVDLNILRDRRGHVADLSLLVSAQRTRSILFHVGHRKLEVPGRPHRS